MTARVYASGAEKIVRQAIDLQEKTINVLRWSRIHSRNQKTLKGKRNLTAPLDTDAMYDFWDKIHRHPN